MIAALAPVAKRGLMVFGLFAVAVVIGYFILRPARMLPVYHPSQLDPRLVDPALRGGTKEHRITDFRLTDQRGKVLTLDSLKGKIILADFFFTTCGSICPKMSTQMVRVQEEFRREPRLMLLSHSVTPERDSVPVLQAYGEQYGVDPAHWLLLTGDRSQIYRLARRSYFAATDEGDGGPDDFVHTENFVLVDPQHRIRGFYDGTSEEDVDRAIGDIKVLLRETKDG